jgi:hypothetical protein
MLVIENVHLHEFMVNRKVTLNGLSLERFLKEKSVVMFEEISSGVYHTLKDRTENQFKYVDSRMVAQCMQHQSRVVIKRLDGKFVTNEDSLEDF